jgi:hypothetical protein
VRGKRFSTLIQSDLLVSLRRIPGFMFEECLARHIGIRPLAFAASGHSLASSDASLSTDISAPDMGTETVCDRILAGPAAEV